MARFDLTDFEWDVILPLIPQKSRGVQRVDDRRVLNGILWRLRSGALWADIPARYSPCTTCVNRFNRWRNAGHWARILQAISEAYRGGIQMIDSASSTVHQHAANLYPAGQSALSPRGGRKAIRSRCIGRSRGGLTTKIHALVDAVGRPIRLKLTEGQAHDGRAAAEMFKSVGAGQILLANRACNSDAWRETPAEREAIANIRLMPNRKRRPGFDAELYKRRNHAERFLCKIRHFRAVATRYDNRDDNVLASLQLASLRVRLRTYESVT